MAAYLPETWRAFGAFLIRPVLPDRAVGVSRAGFATIARLFPLDVLAMALLIGTAGALTAFGFHLPKHALEGLDIGPAVIAFILIGAPIGEEILFRGWLSGRPGHVFAILLLYAGIGLAALATRTLPAQGAGIAALAIVGLALVGIALSLWLGRRKPAWGWFQRHFRWFYYLSALAFAGVHLFNFGGASAAMLPLTLPQFVLGLMLGYVRVNHGLWASMTFHALHNTIFIGLVLAAGGTGG